MPFALLFTVCLIAYSSSFGFSDKYMNIVGSAFVGFFLCFLVVFIRVAGPSFNGWNSTYIFRMCDDTP